MEEIARILIYIHIFTGGIGLLSGIASIVAKKGSPLHKKSGKLFTVGMLVCSILAIPVTLMPNHENIFLLLISLFTIYLIVMGNRMLQFKNRVEANFVDKLISGLMLLFAIVMILLGLYGYIASKSINILFLFFGIIALSLSITDFKFYKNTRKSRNAWLRMHIGKIMGAYISSVTAFIVAGLQLSTLFYWIVPSVLGTFYIVYWTRKVNPNRK